LIVDDEPVRYVGAGLPWLSNIVNYLAEGLVVKGMKFLQRKKFFSYAAHYIWDAPYLFRVGADQILRRCVTREVGLEILKHYHQGLVGVTMGHPTPRKSCLIPISIGRQCSRMLMIF
jgi:hypothetical protein